MKQPSSPRFAFLFLYFNSCFSIPLGVFASPISCSIMVGQSIPLQFQHASFQTVHHVLMVILKGFENSLPTTLVSVLCAVFTAIYHPNLNNIIKMNSKAQRPLFTYLGLGKQRQESGSQYINLVSCSPLC